MASVVLGMAIVAVSGWSMAGTAGDGPTSRSAPVASTGMGGRFIENVPLAGPRQSSASSFGPWSGVTNWSGYVQAGTDGGGSYTEVTDSFVVPTVVTGAKGSQIVSDWVGIGGYGNDSSLVQAGIQAANFDGTPYYRAWTEVLPQGERVLKLPVSPGDTVTVTVQHRHGSWWRMEIQDGTETMSRTVRDGRDGGESAEAVEERPCIKRPCDQPTDFAKLAQTSNVTFVPGSFSTTPWPAPPVETPLLEPGPGGPDLVVMSDADGYAVATPSSPDAADDGFTVADGTSAPSPPNT